MPTAQPLRDRLVGLRVTSHEHDLVRSHAEADQRNLTGLMRKLLAETVAGFGATKQRRTREEIKRDPAEQKETSR